MNSGISSIFLQKLIEIDKLPKYVQSAFDGYKTLIYFSLAVCIFLTYNHRANIKRLMYGEENRFERWWKIRWIQIEAPFKRKKK